MKKLLMTIVALALIVVGSIIGFTLCKNAEEEKCMIFTAVALVQSFGWELDDNQETDAYRLSEEMFHDNYYHVTGGDFVKPTSGLTSGNIIGIAPEILDRSFFISNDQSVNMYEFPIAYDMPAGTSLWGVIAFYEGKICMSCVHVNLDASIISQLSENKEADTKITPLTWPLNVDRNTIEQWKEKFSTLNISSVDIDWASFPIRTTRVSTTVTI